MNSEKIFLALFAALVFLSMSATQVYGLTTAPTFQPAYNLSNDNYNAKDPNVQNSGSNVYVSWTEGSHGIYFRASPNNGTTWNPPITSAALRISNSGGTTQFPLMTDSGSNVYIVWSQTTGSGTPLQLYFAVSKNYGASFSKPVVLDTSSSVGSGAITPAIAASGTDVYVAWLASGVGNYVISSTNNGSTWGSPVKLSSLREPQLAASGSYAYEAGVGALYVSTNNGVTWTNERIAVGSEPWIAAYGSNVIVAWETKNITSKVYIVTSTNNGKTWTKATLLSSSVPNSWAPMVNVTGNVEYVAWRSNPGSANSQEYVSTSTNAGVSWSTPVAIGVAGRDNSWPFTVAVSLNNAFIMWSEKTNTKSSSNDWQTLVSYSNNNGSTWTSLPTLTTSKASAAAPENDVATGAISAYSTNGFAVWQNNATKSQIYFSS